MRAVAAPSLAHSAVFSTPRRRRIALVCDWYLPRIGGIERHLAALARELTTAGYEVTVVTPMPGAQTGDGIRLRHVPTTLIPGATLMWAPRGFRRLGAALRDGAFDLVHVHTSTLSPAAFAAIYHAQRAGLPTVSTTHSTLGHFRPVFGWLHRRFHWGAWRVVYSAVSRRVACEMQPFVSRPVTILPNAIDPSVWSPPATTPSTRPDILIACVMRLVPRKRGDLLLEAYRRARATLPDKRILLHFVGDGPSRRRLEAKARALGVTGDVVFHGGLGHAEIRRILSSADLFALPCRVEAFGLAALEARACGLPVIGMAESGVSEFIRHDREGLLAKDDADFAEQVLALCADPARRHRIAEYNRSHTTEFTWQRALARHEAAYDDARQLAASAVSMCADR